MGLIQTDFCFTKNDMEMTERQSKLFIELERYIGQLDVQSIPTERKAILQPLIDAIQSKVHLGHKIRLNFICTHNSRRSHLSQVWAQAMADYFHVSDVFCYSGGTEATALYPMIAETLKCAGFQIQLLSQGNNPIHGIKFAENEPPIIGFSKKMDDQFNPQSEFIAILTCDSANEACPIVPGAEKRIPITYEDPKAFDETAFQAEKYQERSQQIATEMYFIFSQIKA